MSKARTLVLFVTALLLAGCAAGGRGCRQEPEPPPTVTIPAPPTVAPSVTATSFVRPTKTPTVTPPTSTPGPTAYPPGFTPKPTYLPPIATYTPRPTVPPTPVPTGTPIALKGRVPIVPGDTLWGIACNQYPEYIGLGGCGCWPGLWQSTPRIGNPRLILPGWTVNIPNKCIR